MALPPSRLCETVSLTGMSDIPQQHWLGAGA